MTKRYNPPPNWPQPPQGWTPPQDWQPDPGWGPPLPGWQVWSEEPTKPGMGKGAKITLGVVAGVVALCGIGVVGSALAGDPEPARVVSADKSSAATTDDAESTQSAEDKAAADKAAEEKAAADKAAEEKAAADKAAADKAAADKAAADAAATAAAEAAKGTVAQQNAYGTAVSYLDYSGFSRSGLIDQLLFEEFSAADAEFGVARLEAEGGVDWNAEAAESAKSYLEYTNFSRAGLIDQLLFEGFTAEQAEFGVSQTGL